MLQPRTLSPSSQLLSFLENWEGTSPWIYKCSAGYDTIGIGHKLQNGDMLLSGKKQILLNKRVMNYPLSLEDVKRVKLEDLGKFVQGLQPNVQGVQFSQREFDALLSFSFNLGLGAFNGSTMKKIIKGNLLPNGELSEQGRLQAGEEFIKWSKERVGGKLVSSAGLLKRRQAERKIFLNGDYSGKP